MTPRAHGAAGRARVLQIVPDLRLGGAERVALDLALHLDRTRFDVSILTLYPAADSSFEHEARAAGVPLRHLAKQPGLDLRLQGAVRRVLAELRPDVAHTHNVLLHNLLPGYAATGVPVRVHTVQNVAEREIPRVLRPVHAAAFRWGGVVPVSVSERVHDSVARWYGAVSSPVIENALDTARFARPIESRERWRTANDVPTDAFVLVHVGRFMAQKNHALLLEAFRELTTHAPRAVLMLAGVGELLEVTRARAAALGVGHAVRFLGARADVPDLLHAADAFVLSSDWEGLPVAVLEAMAAGLPVVATSVGGVPEVVEPGRTGWLVPPADAVALADAMAALVADPAAARAVGQRARTLVRERYDVVGMAGRYGELYADLLAGRRAGDGGPARRGA